MASLWQHPKSANWIARFRGSENKTVNRSTGIRDKVEALRMAKSWELEAERERGRRRQQSDSNISASGISDVISRAERMARQGRLNASTAREIINELLIAAGQQPIEVMSTRAWCEGWLAGKAGTIAAVSHKAYTVRCARWMSYLNLKANASIDLVTRADAVSFRDLMVRDKLWMGTINETMSFLRSVHQAAVDEGHLSRNPFAGINVLKARPEVSKAAKRQPFTVSEVSALLKAADTDWKGMILLGATTGLRLIDASTLTWKAIDLDRGLIQLTVRKTSKDIILPIHPRFAQWLSEQPRGIGAAPVFCTLYAKPRGGKKGLCLSFRALMVQAGIPVEMAHSGIGKGRNRAKKSFHSLRHFAATQFANSGVRSEIARAITGHADAQTHANYVTADISALRSAVDKIPLSE